MINLYEERPGQLVTYPYRIPKRDGDLPTSNWQAGAGAVILVSLWALHRLSDSIVRDGEHIFRVLFFLALIAWSAWYILSQYITIVYCGQTRALYKSYVFHRRRLMGFDDIGEIRVLMQEEGGVLLGSYVALWADDPLRKPVRLSPKGETVNRLNRYRHNIIPLAREMIWGDESAEGMSDAAALRAAAAAAAQPRAVPRPPPGKGGQARPASRLYRNTFRSRVFLSFLFDLLVLAAGCRFLWAALIGSGPWQTIVILWVDVFSIAGFGVPVLPFAAFVYAAYRAWKSFVRHARQNVDIVIDAGRREITFGTMFGLHRNRHTFDSLIELTVKHRLGRQCLCAVLDGQYADPVISVHSPGRETRKTLEKICSLMAIDPRQWVDVYMPLPKYSEAYKKRIMRVFNPYYEK